MPLMMSRTLLGYILLIVGCKYGVAYALQVNDRGVIYCFAILHINRAPIVIVNRFRLEYHNNDLNDDLN